MYEYDEPSLGQAFANILRGVKDPQQWQQAGQGIVNTAQIIPNVAESLARGGVAQAVGTMGDLRDLRNTVQSYLPQSVQNWSNAAEFLTNPYAKALVQTAPTTEQTLETVPRITPTYEGAGQHETLGEYIAPSLGYFGGKALKAGKGLPVGLSIEDVTPKVEPAKVAEALRQPEKNALGLFSPLEEAVLNLKNEKGTGQQYLAQLLKTQGVKQEEVATRGLDTFLNENPKVSKEQLINYLRENPVKLKETVLQEGSKRNLDSTPYSEYELRGGDVIDDTDYIDNLANDEYFYIKNDNPEIVDEFRQKAYEDLEIDPHDMDLSQQNKVDDYVDDLIRERAENNARDMYYENPYRTYYDDLGYEVSGNDDVGYYIKDPQGREVSTGRSGIYDISDVEARIKEDALDNGLLHLDEDEYGTKYHDYTLPNGENYKEVLIQYPTDLDKVNAARDKWFALQKENSQLPDDSPKLKANVQEMEKLNKLIDFRSQEFESGHFDEPNILVHFRTTDRTIDGKKTLFVEEIQSDWHQQGRKKGYQSGNPTKEFEDYEKNLVTRAREAMKQNALKDGLSEKEADDLSTSIVRNTDFNGMAKYLNETDKYTELALRARNKANLVPDAPFKKNWQELAMKRAMQMAAEGGYDRVAFTTGKQQADRYSLSKHINELTYNPKTKQLWAYKEGNYSPVISKTVEPDDLPDVIGKEAAKKLLETEMTPLTTNNGEEFAHQLTGQALDVGGEGMKGFYDKILPDFINKYGKKHGLKVGQTNLKGGNIPDNEKQFYEIGKKYGYTRDQFDDLAPAERRKIFDKELAGEQVHYFDLTPEAKESFLKKGQPMFAVAPALAITDEDSRREVLEKLFNSKK